MMIARDNCKWMPVRQASRLTERQDKEKTRDKRLLARTQFGKRLLLLPCVEASEVIPSEEEEEEWYTEKGVSKDPTASTRMLDQEEREDAQWIERRAQEFCGARGSASQESRKQVEVRGLEIKTQGTSQQEADESQINIGRRDRHAHRIAGRLGRGGRIPGLRLQQL
jgi:hypothetical protein